MIQTQLATLKFPKIGSISSITDLGEPVIGKLSTAAAQGLVPQGPYTTSHEFFIAVGEAALRRATPTEASDKPDTLRSFRLGSLVFLDIVRTTGLFGSLEESYPLNHMDMGLQNIIVDDGFNFLGVIDWEFAQTAPSQVNHYPIPFSLLWSDDKIQTALADPTHIAHRNISLQARARSLYSRLFRKAENTLRDVNQSLNRIPQVLDSPASRIYHCFTRMGCAQGQDADLIREMVRLAWGIDGVGRNEYLKGYGTLADID